MDGNKKRKLSGYEFKKKREEKEKRQEKDKNSLLKFLVNSNVPIEDSDNVECQASTSTSASINTAVSNDTLNEHLEIEEVETQLVNDNILGDVVITDPGTWPKVDEKLRLLIIQNDVIQIEIKPFPIDKDNRKFTKFHYERKLSNGEKIRRSWLQYSLGKDKVYCMCCKLFPSAASDALFNENGTNDWKNLAAQLSSHERNAKHLQCFQLWQELKLRLETGRTIDQ